MPSPPSRDPWRLAALDRLGSDLRRLEQEDELARSRAPSRRWPSLALLAGGLSIALAILVVFDQGRPAGALSIVNRAPQAAARSVSVDFHSTTTIASGGHTIRRFSQGGEINFATGEYGTAIDVIGSGVSIERRTVGSVLYVGERSGPPAATRPIRWIAVRLTGAQRTGLASVPESQAFTEPLDVLGSLAATSSPVRSLGRESIGGIATVHYRLLTDLASILRASAQSEQARSRYRSVQATVNVWLDGRGRPIRIAEVFAARRASGLLSVETVVDFSAYGRPVHLAAPSGVRPTSALRSGPQGPLAADPSRVYERLLFASR